MLLRYDLDVKQYTKSRVRTDAKEQEKYNYLVYTIKVPEGIKIKMNEGRVNYMIIGPSSKVHRLFASFYTILVQSCISWTTEFFEMDHLR